MISCRGFLEYNRKYIPLTFVSSCWSCLLCSSTCLSSAFAIISTVSFPDGNNVFTSGLVRQQLLIVCPLQAAVVCNESVLVLSLSPFTKLLSDEAPSLWMAVLSLRTGSLLSLHSNWFCATTPLVVQFRTSWDCSVLLPCFCSECWVRNFGWGDVVNPCFPWDLTTLITQGSFFSSLRLDGLRRTRDRKWKRMHVT